jgi:hypothetical protein
MPGFLGGSSGSSGTGGEITFPKEFIDPVTKLRVSQPENLIDTDFEYGLQPTKWETVELINNTPSFFSKSGDTTIPGIVAISTNNGTREITVTTATDHGLAVGIPINVTGTKSVTADGSYVINSIPNLTTFTYLCKDEQIGNNSIEDLYSSIITGEFFQGSQIRISDAEGVITDAEAISTLTVKTDSTHGFGLNTPFYFLNLNSTISQEFEASNTAAKSFDSSNSATAQTFDGSNTLSTFNIDWSNSATVGGITSTISGVSTVNDTITVAHGAENFASQPLGTPLYYNLTTLASSGYFNTNPRGVVFLKTTNALNSPAGESTFQVSAVPDGDAIEIVSNMSGTFQLANQARTFAGNNIDPATETSLTILADSPKGVDIANNGGAIATGRIVTQTSYSGSLVNGTADDGAGSLDWYQGTMVRYSTTGSAATGLSNNTTYFIDSVFPTSGAGYAFTLKPLPTSSAITSISGGTGTQTFTKIGVSVDRDVFHVKNHGFVERDMVKYIYPESGRFTTVDAADQKDFYFIETVYDAHNFTLTGSLSLTATGGNITQFGVYKVHTFLDSGNFVVSAGTGNAEALIVAGGGAGGGRHGGGGGAGGMVEVINIPLTAGTYPIVIGNGAAVNSAYTPSPSRGATGSNSTAFGNTAFGGGGGGTYSDSGNQNASGGGSAGGFGYAADGVASATRGTITVGTGNTFGTNSSARSTGGVTGTGGGGAGNNTNNLAGGSGRQNNIDGNNYYYAGGGGGSSWGASGGGNVDIRGGIGGGGGGGSAAETISPSSLYAGGGSARNAGGNGVTGSTGGAGQSGTGGNGGANTGGGGGGSGQNGGFPNYNGYGGGGGKGIVIVRYQG